MTCHALFRVAGTGVHTVPCHASIIYSRHVRSRERVSLPGRLMPDLAKMVARLSLLARRADVFATALVVWSAIKATQRYLRLRARILGHDPAVYTDAVVEALWSRTHAWAAERIKRLAKRRAALWLKFAQYIASRADILPSEYTTSLVECLDAVPPEPPEVVAETVREELGGKDPDEVFDHFDPSEPIASASIAQVFRAKLSENGEAVALKVQRRGVRQLLHQDLVDLKRIMELVAGAEPEFDFRPMMDAWIDNVPNECNFVVEASNCEAVRAVLESARGTEFESVAAVPRTYPQYTSERLLVMEWIEGCSILDVDALEAAGADYDHIISEITKAMALQVYFRGLATADSHPGNIICDRLVSGGAAVRPVLIDFGITFKMNERERLGFARMILASIESSSFRLLQSFQDMRIVLNRADPSSSMAFIRHLFRTTASREETVRQSKEFLADMKMRKESPVESGIAVEGGNKGRMDSSNAEKNKKVNPVDAMPGYLVFAFRAISLLRGLGTRLGVQHACLPIFARYAEHILREACPPDERIQTILYPEPTNTPGSLSRGQSKRLRMVMGHVLEMLRNRGLIVGCQVSATLDGEVVLDVAAGQMGVYNPRPVTPASLFNVFSVSKGVMSIIYGIVADEHGLNSSDLVGKHWPEFACHGKEETQLKHILGHTAGLAHAAPADMSMIRLRDDWRGVVKWLAEEARPAHRPGERSEYHYLNYGWLLGGLLEKVTQKSPVRLVEELADALGIRDECFLGLPDALCRDDPQSRVAMLHSQILVEIAELMKRKKQSPRSNEIPVVDEVSALLQSGETAENSVSIDTRNDALLGGNTRAGSGEVDASQFIFDLLFGRTVKDGGGEVKDKNCGKKPLDAESVFARTPYLLDPEYFSHEVMRAAVIPSANMHMSARALARMYGIMANGGRIAGSLQIMNPARPQKLMEVTYDAEITNEDPKSGTGRQESPLAVGETFAAGFRLYDVVDTDGNFMKNGGVGHAGLGGCNAFAVPESKFSIAFTCNQLNIFSVAETVVTGITCRMLRVPMPVRHHEVFSRIKTDFDNGGSFDDVLETVEQAVDIAVNKMNLGEALTG